LIELYFIIRNLI